MALFKWTGKLKKAAHEGLLARANSMEVKHRKYLKNVRYSADGTARWSGPGYDYTINVNPQTEKNGGTL